MRIRWKLLILLLVASLVPLAGTSLLQRLSARRLGKHLASDSRRMLIVDAEEDLRQLVEGYGHLLRRDRKAVETTLLYQASEVERRLAGPVPDSPTIVTAADFDTREDAAWKMQPSRYHKTVDASGSERPVRVSYEQQVYWLPGGVDSAAVTRDMARLSTMPAAYAAVCDPSLMALQYTSLDVGVHTSYPGRGGYPRDYDPRKRPWYIDARAGQGRTAMTTPLVDVRSRSTTLTLSRAVHRPDGAFAGVTAIDIPLTAIFDELNLPERWWGAAEIKFVTIAPPGSDQDGKLLIIAQRSDEDTSQDWATLRKPQVLTCDRPEQLQALVRDAATTSGVRQMSYRGRQCIWAHAASAGEAFPIVIVPYDRVIAHAVAAEQYVWGETVAGLRDTGFVLLGVTVVVVLVAVRASRTVTRPVREIAEAGRRLASGDFDARVDIHRNDELGELAGVFNATGPHLKEHQEIKQSLDVAREIQQSLLPQGPPVVEGFDISGNILYCDQTGGDYYDFIELVDLPGDKLGITIGDVTGHGIGAALLMASARGVLRSHAGLHGADLAGLFTVLNRHLVRDTGDARFMTLFYGLLDAPTRCLTWISAGHDPAIWMRTETGRFEELPTGGIPLGVLDGYAFEPGGPVTLEPGDVVVLGTDGIWEAQNPSGEMFGKDRLREVVSKTADQPAAAIHEAIVEAVHAFRDGAPQTDDITLVIVKSL